MPFRVEFEFAAKTDPGKVRSQNEDAIAVCLPQGVAILADGMGGYSAGEVASTIATDTVEDVLARDLRNFDWSARVSRSTRLTRMIRQAIECANDAIIKTAQREPRYRGMGTTLVAALFHHDKMIVAHVGDSRLYRWRDGELDLLTRDHSFLQEQVDAGLMSAEQARLSPSRNLITRALGIDSALDVEIHEYTTQANDLYLLCSDGLSDMLAHQAIGDLLRDTEDGLNAMCDTLVQCANANGGRDNISIILIKIQKCEAEAERMMDRMLKWIR
jgi:serine/threonine protein phosphatase PrpC